jgi:hypothetical protein
MEEGSGEDMVGRGGCGPRLTEIKAMAEPARLYTLLASRRYS